MSKKRGLSLEEKRTKMMELFYEKKEFFQMKELEKIGPKEKGVISQSVKEVVQSLVDDNMVDTEKIGTFVCYWSFPSKAVNTKQRRLTDLSAKATTTNVKCEEIKRKVAQLQSTNENADERRALDRRLAELTSRSNAQKVELARFSAFDPSTLAKQRQDTETAMGAANRWTDNIFSARQWMKKKFGMNEKELNKNFSIPDELDYLE